jgi:TPR repeat protein
MKITKRAPRPRRAGLAVICAAGLLQPAWADGPAAAFNPAALAEAAQAGDAQAAFQLGTLNYTGLGVVQDYVAARTLLTQAANAGNAEAACELGFLYQTGSFAQGPPPPDPKTAASWYEKSAAAKNPCGEFALGALYQSGTGVAADPAQAASLFAAAAAQGFTQDSASFPLQQLQQHIYATAYKITGQSQWVDTVSAAAGGGQ